VDRLTSALTILEKHLATRTYLATERSLLPTSRSPRNSNLPSSSPVDSALCVKLPIVLRHFGTVLNQPNLPSLFGPTAFGEKALQHTPPPKEKKGKSPAAPAQPKAEKKPQKEEVDDDDDDDKPLQEAPKEKDPLHLLLKLTVNPEDWKRAYSNKDTRGADGAVEWLYEKCVRYSIIFADGIRAVTTRTATQFGVWTLSTTRSSRRRSCLRIR